MSRPPRRRSLRSFGLTAALALVVVPSALLAGAYPGVGQVVLLGLVAAGMVLALIAG
jgi:hypothetical protein